MSLTPAQLDGRDCIICGRGDCPMVPIYVETPTSTMVFRCSSCDCDEPTARRLVDDAANTKVSHGGA